MRLSTQEQVQKMTTSTVDKIRLMALAMLDPNRTMETMVRDWHTGMGAAVRDIPTFLPIPDVERRLRLTLEEFLETVFHSGFTVVSKTTGEDISKDLKLVPVAGREQNLVEIADGICDQIVVNLGHAAEHGIYLKPIFEEIMFSNATKLPMDGISVVNRCVFTDTDPLHDCGTNTADCVLLDPEAPIGKILKPAGYIKADVAKVLAAQVV